MWATLERKVNTVSEALDGVRGTLGKNQMTLEQTLGGRNSAAAASGGECRQAAVQLCYVAAFYDVCVSVNV
jgi:hypothetical protein